ncbi:MAG TPA: chorismate-binding protein [Bacteroidia bacterium]|nr:chorismate-binding protein [Bacteroidia bacterium]
MNVDYEHIKRQFYFSVNSHLGFAAWKRPGEHTIHAIYGPVIRKDIHTVEENSFVIHPFNPGNGVCCIRKDNVMPDKNAKAQWYVNNSKSYDYSREDFYTLVNNALNEIQRHKLVKVVVSRQSGMKLPDNFCPVRLFLSAAQKYSHAFVSLVSTPEYGTWLGATPELFFSVKNSTFEIHSLAGTLLHAGNENETIVKKNKSEQERVSEYLRELLFHLKIDFRESLPEYFTAGELRHFLSRFTGEINKEQIIRLLEELHPTPAIGGLPKNPALQFLLKNEKHDRQLFGGYLGYFSSYQDFSFFVNLRCVKVLKDRLQFFAGAGIVDGSIAELEWDETEKKMDTLRNLLTL